MLPLSTGCSSGRFIELIPSDETVLVHTNGTPYLNPYLPVWKQLSSDEIKKQCFKHLDDKLLTHLLRTICAQELLSRSPISPLEKFGLLQTHNKNLSFLVQQLLLKKGSLLHGNVRVTLDTSLEERQQYFLTQHLKTLDNYLTIKDHGQIGVPAITYRSNTGYGRDPFYPKEGIFRNATFVMKSLTRSPAGWHLTIQLQPMNHTKSLEIGNNRYQIAYTPAAAYLLLLEHANIDQFSWDGFFNAELAENRRGIFAIEPIDNQKIPILMIHGLNSDPLIWRHLSLNILNDKELHSRYQIWHAFYPSGPPPFFNGMLLRKRLKALLALSADRHVQNSRSQNSHNQKQMVYIGHSMGGILAHTMVVDSGYQLWDTTFKERPEQLSIAPNDPITDLLIFKPLTQHNQVFFLDTPHRGSDTASSFVGNVSSTLVNLPQNFISMIKTLIDSIGLDRVTQRMLPYLRNNGPNSVQVLRPGHPLLETLNELPIAGTAYSIIGSQSDMECDTQEQCHNITDSVVNYASAHLSQAEQEIIVPSNHNSYQSEEAIRFILTKLKASQ
ncbi:esterase/lipase family protein [Litoribrevibacter euphylliae]|uniref:Esterase/lipase family protein n=1 Tax=Litoribrevibacter euphylliae TaxID=1834034 RepID=A0ABV7HF88_9GAMM